MALTNEVPHSSAVGCILADVERLSQKVRNLLCQFLRSRFLLGSCELTPLIINDSRRQVTPSDKVGVQDLTQLFPLVGQPLDICQARGGQIAHSSAVGLPENGATPSRVGGYPSSGRNRDRQMSSSAGLGHWLSYPIIWFIYLYRMTLAPFMATFFGGGCRFEPSCSHYAEDALRKYGAWRGSIMAVKRLSCCHPWHDGGYDPVR